MTCIGAPKVGASL